MPDLNQTDNQPAGMAVRHFHDATSHLANASGFGEQFARSMDETIRPRLHKLYTTLEPMPLPREGTPLTMPALDAIADSGGGGAAGEQIPDVATVAQLLLLTDGVTRQIRRGDRVLDFRAAPCTGALYHVELYMVCGDLPGLPAGVYHYGAHDHALRQLRDGDFRAHIVDASGAEPAIASAPAIMVTTSVYWRNAWKYLDRAYRHTYWDTGTMLPNTLAVSAAAGVPAQMVFGFADQPVADLIDVDLDKEGVISLVALGRTSGDAPPSPPVEALDLPTEPYSAGELDLPLIPDTHRVTLLRTGEDAAAWRSTPSTAGTREPAAGSLVELPSPDQSTLPDDSIEQVIRRRGSSRRFTRDAISVGQLSTLLDRATRGLPSDSLGEDGVPLNTAYVIVNAVEGLESGIWVYHPDRQALEMVQPVTEEDMRAQAAQLALGQDLGGDAAVNIYFLADLDPVLASHGERGYRLAQLGSALVAGKLYLAAYANRLGATGLTFFDDAVVDLLSPHAAGKSVMFLIAIGVPARAA